MQGEKGGALVATPSRRGSKRLLTGLVLALASVCACLLLLEGALRVRRGSLTDFASLHRSADILQRGVPLQHDPELGWSNVAAARFSKDELHISIDEAGFRINGNDSVASRPLVLALGDSFTFGLESADGETWPALLEARLGSRVLNAGVTAYGFDQVVLRACALVPLLRPELLIVCLVADDVRRCQYAYRWGSRKPWFVPDDGAPDGLRLCGQPVPADEHPRARFATLRKLLSYSHLADALLQRAAPEWWLGGRGIEQVHRKGELVATRLVERLGRLQRETGVPILFVVEWARGNERRLVEPLLARAREVSLATVDLSLELQRLVERDPSTFGDSHLTGRGNAWVAEQLLPLVRGQLDL